jgi:cyclopropane fatty-acyl-phospholipid synthase-like methyltransferase
MIRRLTPLVLAACSSTQTPAPAPAVAAKHDHGGHGGHEGHHAGHHFKDASKWAAIFDDPARDAWQKPDAVVAALALAPGMTVADIGAGTGYFEARLAAGVGPTGTVLAVDLEPDMVRYLGERAVRENTPNVKPTLGAPDSPNLAPASVDRILIVDTWHHLAARDLYTAKLATALKPDGYILVVDFTLDAKQGPPRAMRLAPTVVVADLMNGGLRASILDESLPDQYIVKGER